MDKKKPADLLIFSYLNGETWAFDFTVASEYAKATKIEALLDVLAAAAKAAEDKYDKYAKELEEFQYKFQPIPMQAIGGLDESAVLFAKTLAGRAAKFLECTAAQAMNILFRRTSVILAKGLAGMATRRLIPRDRRLIDPQLHSYRV